MCLSRLCRTSCAVMRKRGSHCKRRESRCSPHLSEKPLSKGSRCCNAWATSRHYTRARGKHMLSRDVYQSMPQNCSEKRWEAPRNRPVVR